MRRGSIRIIALLATLVTVLSCGGADGIAPPTSAEPGAIARASDSSLLAGLNVSGPIAEELVPPFFSVINASVALSAELSYVSLVPGTVSNGTTATIINLRNQHHETVQIGDGGFDPFPIPASLGDSLLITVSRAGQPDAVAYTAVAARLAPRIVRTRPPRGQTDAPLNTVITIVFTEPVNPASVNSASVTLRAGASPVAGTVRMLPELGYTVEFTPSALLTPGTTYSLTVDGVTNFAGIPLAAPASITFTTGSPTDAAVSVVVSPDSATMRVGEELQLAVTRKNAAGQVLAPSRPLWNSSAPDVARVNPWWGTVIAIGTGTAVITAFSDGLTDTVRITVNPTTTPVGAIVTSQCILEVFCALYALEPDGSNARYLTGGTKDDFGDMFGSDFGPAWSPDGNYIAFSSDRHCAIELRFPCHADLYVMKVDAFGATTPESGVRSLTRDWERDWDLEVGQLSWSPDGSRIVFAAGARPGWWTYGRGNLYVVNADGSGRRLFVSAPSGGSVGFPDWSPDGNKIAYVDSLAINVVNADGSNAIPISKPPASFRDLAPRWSPDGKRIAFSRHWFANGNAAPASPCQVFVMDADGSNATALTHDSECYNFPTWSPDGKRIALGGNYTKDLVVMNADGSDRKVILSPWERWGATISWRKRDIATPSASARPGVKP